MFASYSKVFSPVKTHLDMTVDPQISSGPNFHFIPKLELNDCSVLK